ncbi:MAG TPA: hypothetical protein VGB67_07425, partial [Fibrella sp.]
TADLYGPLHNERLIASFVNYTLCRARSVASGYQPYVAAGLAVGWIKLQHSNHEYPDNQTLPGKMRG